MNCSFENGGIVSVLSRMDAGAQNAAPPGNDGGLVHLDARSEPGCANGSDCPAGTTLLMATYSVPCIERTIVCRRAPSGDSLWMSGDFTRADVEAIASIIARMDALPLLSVELRRDVATARTECPRDCLVNGGWLYRLRKADGAWTVTERSMEIE